MLCPLVGSGSFPFEVKIERDTILNMNFSLIVSYHWNQKINNKGSQGGGGSWSQLSWNHSPHLPFWRCCGNSLLGKLHQSKKVEHGLKLETENNVYCT